MTRLINLMKVTSIAALCIGFAIPSSAEDTEIYQAEADATTTGRPKVLIIFDDSGSMRTDVEVQPPPYDPSVTYDGTRHRDRIYFATNDPSEYFPVSVNRCSESYAALTTAGFFQGRIQRASGSTSNRWRNLGDNDWTRGTAHVDCEADLINNNNGNGDGQPDGYPCEGGGNVNTWYCTAKENINWGGSETLYTGNYVNWFRGVGDTTRSRLDIAIDTVVAIITANPSIDFGLALFNDNDDGQDGGRIVNRIIENSTLAQRATLINNVNAIEHNGWTPLCETTYEAYRYLAGLDLVYGDERDTSTADDGQTDTPDRDGYAETTFKSGTYDSPASDCAYTYVILMTDGEPSHDEDANSAIETLTGTTCQNYRDYNGNMRKNCLPDIAEYMANTDLDNDTTNGNQFALTYTIGFATDQVMLEDTAAKGKGQYYTADSATGLATAFQSAITEILGTNESFTSPAVAVDTFSRTESRNEVFFAMFEPRDRINWKGNIKRLNLAIENGVAILRDGNGDAAFDNSTGRIADDAQTVWSTSQDGDKVDEGGVGALLAARNPVSNPRSLYSNTGDSDALQTFNLTNMDVDAFGFAGDDELYDFFNVADWNEFETLINWARGIDVFDEDEDGSRTDAQPWILADMLHSRPIVVNYGARGSFTQSNPDQRLLVGTNGGFFHMFDVDSGQENWAFFPKELGPILKPRLTDAASTQHVYGIDAPPTTYIEDGGDGTISGSDTAYIYFGLRRGGRDMYALNISNPDTPSFLWKITGGSGDFAELGQTWSAPVVTTIPGYYDMVDHDNDADTDDIAVYKKVLIFGAGYDTNKDATGLGTADSMGRGVFIVDATTGQLIRSFTPATGSSTNIQVAGLSHSVPASVTTIDTNGDTISDRLYFGDTGGNLWRIDMPGNTLHGNATPSPDSYTAVWYATKLAAVNGGTTASDRRFFNAPDVVRSKRKVCKEYHPSPDDTICKIATVINYDAVVLGTGDRTNPNAVDVDNQFYMFRDERISPYDSAAPTSGACSTAIATDPPVPVDFRCYLPLGTGDLYDATSNIIQTGSTTQQAAAEAALEGKNGWLLNLSVNGEKSLSRSLTLYGSVFFTTFSPNSSVASANSCVPQAGTGRLYQVALQDARAKRHFDNDGVLDRSIDLGTLIPDTPSPHFGSDKKIRLLFPSGGGLLSGNPLDTGAEMPQPYGIYWYREEL